MKLRNLGAETRILFPVIPGPIRSTDDPGRRTPRRGTRRMVPGTSAPQPPVSTVTANDPLPNPPLLLKLPPPLHRNPARVELPFIPMTPLISALDRSGRLPGVAPREVVEVPVGVGGEDEVPDGQRDEVDEHPGDVDDAVGGDDDEEARETEDECEEDQGDRRGWGVGGEGDETFGDCLLRLGISMMDSFAFCGDSGL